MVRRRPGRFERHVAELAIIVSNKERGMGIGRSMVATAVDWCRVVRVAKIELSVFPDNAGAIALYRRCGFVDEGLRRAAIRLPDGEHDLLLMALDLRD
jgi:RimJ/RimL family protein N-acetyltransferase